MRGSWRPNKDCNILTPQLFWLSQPFLPVLPGCSSGRLRVQPLLGHSSHSSIFSPTLSSSELQLIWTSWRRGYIIIWHPPTSCERHNFALNSTPRQSRLPLISWYLRPDAPVIYTGAFLLLTAWPGRRSICKISLTTSNHLKKCPGLFHYQTLFY